MTNKRQNDGKHRFDVNVSQNVGSVSESARVTGINIDASGVGNLSIDFGPAEKSDPLKQLSALSRIAVSEAEYFVGDELSGRNDAVALDESLYVARTIEKEQNVSDWIDKSIATDYTPILIGGDAGNGKTTLLWHMYRELEASDGYHPFFVKSSWLLAGSEFDSSILTGGITDMDEPGPQPVLLLDTVDLLMHAERDMYQLLELISRLQDLHAVVAMTCRPRETAVLRHHLKPDFKYLSGYDDVELEEAIGKHVARFYACADTRERFEHVQRITDAVTRGMPVRDVCKNPLALRMLFLLYAPGEVPEEIHAVRLYDEFWRKRVEKDQRAGDSATSGKRSTNLSEPARIAALVMLAEGSPEIDGRLLANALRQAGRSESDIDLLVNRGVLLRSRHGVGFFHQTFFEYGAASALLGMRGPESVGFLGNRVRQNPSDLFVVPVYEHLLLQAGNGISRERQAAYRALKALFENGRLTTAISGVYVYCHLRAVPTDIQSGFRDFIRDASSELVNQYLKYAHNTDMTRVGQLFADLDLIWEKGDFRKRRYVVEILERFSLRRDTVPCVIDFIEKHKVSDYGLSMYPKTDEVRRIARVIAALSRHDPRFSWNGLMRLYEKTLEKTQKRDFTRFIIGLVCRDREAYGIDVASRLEKELTALRNDYKGIQEETSRFYGKMWAYEWTRTNKTTATVLKEISSKEKLHFNASLNGLAELLLLRDEKDIETAFAAFSSETDMRKRWLWSRIVWADMIDADFYRTLETEVVWSAFARRQFVLDFISKLFGAYSEKGEFGEKISEMTVLNLIEAVRQANLSDEDFAALFSADGFEKSEPWLDPKGFGRLLSRALRDGAPFAVRAVEVLSDDPKKNPKTVDSVLPVLAEKAAFDDKSMDALIRIATRTRKYEALVHAVESITPPISPVAKQYCRKIDAIKTELMDSKSSNERGLGYRLWFGLVKLDFIGPPEIENIAEKMN